MAEQKEDFYKKRVEKILRFLVYKNLPYFNSELANKKATLETKKAAASNQLEYSNVLSEEFDMLLEELKGYVTEAVIENYKWEKSQIISSEEKISKMRNYAKRERHSAAESALAGIFNIYIHCSTNKFELISALVQEYQDNRFNRYTDKFDELFKAFIYLLLKLKEINTSDYEVLGSFLHNFNYQKLDICSQEFNDAVNGLIAFLQEKEKLYLPQFNRSEIVEELLSVILLPVLVNQSDRNLCGVDICLRALAEKSPLRFVHLGLNLAMKGFSEIPVSAQIPKDSNDSSIILIMMSAIRHAFNAFGYQPKGFFEDLRGATLPGDVHKWFVASGFHVFQDSMTLLNENYEKISSLYNVMGKMHADSHMLLDPENEIQTLKKYTADKNFSVYGLISPAFAKKLNSISPQQVTEIPELSPVPTVLGIQYGHYVKVLSFKEAENQNVSLYINTYGTNFWIYVHRDVFKKHFFGSLVVEFKNPLTLSQLSKATNDISQNDEMSKGIEKTVCVIS